MACANGWRARARPIRGKPERHAKTRGKGMGRPISLAIRADTTYHLNEDLEVSGYDAIVAGAGLWGCTLARVLADAGKRVLVLERRDAPGGNCRCETDPVTGIEVHLHGAHVFHTRLPGVWSFVRRFTEFNGYQHKVLARHAGRTYFLPLGLALVNAFYGKDLLPSELPGFVAREAAAAGAPAEPRNFEEQAIALVGRPLYEAFIRGYTRKQWGCDPKELDASVIRRLPVRASYDVNYYEDHLQGIPLHGYNAVFSAMLDHPLVELRCGVDYLRERGRLPHGAPVFYSGPIDEYFGYRFGPLPWRTLRFEREEKPVPDWQGTSVVNYVDADVPFTRVHEFKHFHPEDKERMARPVTIVCREYASAWRPGDEPYYPVDSAASSRLLARYRSEAAKIPDLVIGGRLGEYKYYDMDRTIGRALEAARGFLRPRPSPRRAPPPRGTAT